MTTPEVRRLAYSVISCYPQARSGWCVHVAVVVVDPITKRHHVERGNQLRLDKVLVGKQGQQVRDHLLFLLVEAPDDPMDWLFDMHRASGELIRTSLPQAIHAPSLVAAMQILVGQLFDVTEGVK